MRRRLTALGYTGPFTPDFGAAEDRASWRATFAHRLTEIERHQG